MHCHCGIGASPVVKSNEAFLLLKYGESKLAFNGPRENHFDKAAPFMFVAMAGWDDNTKGQNAFIQ